MMKRTSNLLLSGIMVLTLVSGSLAQKDRKDEKPPEKQKEKIVEKPKPTPAPERKKPN